MNREEATLFIFGRLGFQPDYLVGKARWELEDFLFFLGSDDFLYSCPYRELGKAFYAALCQDELSQVVLKACFQSSVESLLSSRNKDVSDFAQSCLGVRDISEFPLDTFSL